MLVLFCDNDEIGRGNTWKDIGMHTYPHTAVQSYIYNNGYIYSTGENTWFRCDITPVLIEDVPKVLQTLVLLLNL